MFKWISFLSSLFTLPLVAFGAIVRLNGAGLSCPDWPLCYGKIIPPPGLEIALEMGHRFVATALGIFIIFLVFLAYKSARYARFRSLSIASLALVILQGILGALTVTMDLWPPIVSLHLLGGIALFGLLIVLTFLSFREDVTPGFEAYSIGTHPLLSKKLLGLIAIFFIILVSGAANSTTYSGYACEGFPGCHSDSLLSFGINEASPMGEKVASFPKELDESFLGSYQDEWFHMIHRLLALIGVLIIAYGVMVTLLRKQEVAYRNSGLGILILLAIEFFIGITNALYSVPIPISTIHTFLAASIFGILSFAFAKSLIGQKQ